MAGRRRWPTWAGWTRPAGRRTWRGRRRIPCWVTCEADGAPELILQRRGRHKDTWPGFLDVTVGGHFKAGLYKK